MAASHPIERRRIGATDVEVTALGLGCGSIGSPNIDDVEAANIVRRAYEAGIHYFDTAPLYGRGRSETRVGAVLSQKPRSDFVISTKVGRLLIPAAVEPGTRRSDPAKVAVRFDYSYTAARESLEASFDRLALDRADIVLCHDIDVFTHGTDQPRVFEAATRGVLPALRDLRRVGIIGAYGLGVNEAQVCSQIMEQFDVDCFLLAGRFTLFEQEPLEDLLPKCLERNISVIIGGPYNSGLLARAERAQATYNNQPVNDECWARAQEIRKICERHQVDIRAAALQYPMRHPAVASVIPGSASLHELEENLQLASAPLPPELWFELEAAGLVRDLA